MKDQSVEKHIAAIKNKATQHDKSISCPKGKGDAILRLLR